MVKELKMYTVICDNCGCDACEGSDYSCWQDKETAIEVAMDGNWITDDGKEYCDKCYRYYDDEGDRIIIDITRKDKHRKEVNNG